MTDQPTPYPVIVAGEPGGNNIRWVEPRDAARVQELRPNTRFGPSFLHGLVLTDEHDVPVLFVGVWTLAEVHMGIDRNWGTPLERFGAVERVDAAMRSELRRMGIETAVTWLEEPQPFLRRLLRWGWKTSKLLTVWKGI